MAIAAETPRVRHAGNGTRGPFSLSVSGVPITYSDASEIYVVRYDADGVGTGLVNGTHYTLSADSVLPDVGEVVQTVTSATLSLEATQAVLAADEFLVIVRATTPDQEVVLTPSGGFSSASTERQYDVILRHIQELRESVARSLRINALDSTLAQFASPGLQEFPLVADRGGKILAFDDDGNLIASDRPVDGVDGAQGPAGPQGATGAQGPAGAAGSGTGDVLGPATNADNGFPTWNGPNSKTLKDISASQYRTNLGLGSAALLASSAVFQTTNNLSEGNASTMRSNLGLGSVALLASSAVFQVSNNLSEGSAATKRTNLGLGSAAILDEATTAEYLANTANKVLTTDQVWAAGALVTLTDAATVAVDFGLGVNFELEIGGNRTLGAPTNTKVGQSGVIYVTQDAAGNRTLAYHSRYKWAGGNDGVLSTGAGKVDRLAYFIKSSTFIELSLSKDLR